MIQHIFNVNCVVLNAKLVYIKVKIVQFVLMIELIFRIAKIVLKVNMMIILIPHVKIVITPVLNVQSTLQIAYHAQITKYY